MAALDLGGGLGCISIHDMEERVSPSKPFTTVLEIVEAMGALLKAVLLISTRSGKSTYNSRLRISVNGFNVSRIAKPASELMYRGEYHSIFTYDLTPIKDRISGRVEVEVESRDLEVYVDGVSLVTVHSSNPSLEHSSNSIHIGPYVLGDGERAYIRVRSFRGGDLVIRGIAIPGRRSTADLELDMGCGGLRKIPIQAPSELFLKLSNVELDGEAEIEVRSKCGGGECYAKIPWIFVSSTRARNPDYSIKSLSISDSGQELIVDFENLGDVDAPELSAVAIWRGSVLGRAVVKPSKAGRIVLPLQKKPLILDGSAAQNQIVARLIWKWMGRVEEREKTLDLGRAGTA